MASFCFTSHFEWTDFYQGYATLQFSKFRYYFTIDLSEVSAETNLRQTCLVKNKVTIDICSYQKKTEEKVRKQKLTAENCWNRDSYLRILSVFFSY